MKKIFLLLCILLLSSQIMAQVVLNKEAEVKRLYELIIEYQNKKDYLSVMNSILRILELEPNDFQAKQYLLAGLRGYFDLISQNEYILIESLKHIKQIDDIGQLPLSNMIAFYYNSYKLDELKNLLREIIISDTSKLSINITPLLNINKEKDPELFREIINTVRPYVRDNQLSSWLMLSIYSEDNLGLEKMFAELNIRIEDVTLCMDTSELNSLLNIYINSYTEGGAVIMDEIFVRFKECFEKNDPIKLAIFYYKHNLTEELVAALDKIENEKLKIKPRFQDILRIDREINPVLADRLIKVYLSQISLSSLDRTQYINYLYSMSLYDELSNVLDMIEKNNIKLSVSLTDFSEIEVKKNVVIANRIFSLYWKGLDQNEISKSNDVKSLYQCIKQLYLAQLGYYCSILINRIDKLIQSQEDDYSILVIKGIITLLSDNERLALRIFNQISILGYKEEKEYLAQELNWWNSAINSDLINRALSLLSENLNKDEAISLTGEDGQHTESVKSKEIKIVNPDKSMYHALLIGVKDYNESKLNLVYPLTDVNNLAKVIVENYTFSIENVKILENPTRADIFRTLIEYRSNLSENDNLLIFYAGHGWWDEDMEQGYWLPANAELNIRVNWITNSEITEYVKAIKTKHTLLVSDACFSGSIFKTRSMFVNTNRNIDLVYGKPSRKAITSGTLISVPDKSVFIEYLLKKLEDNQEKYLPAEKLYLNFRDAVTNNSINKQRPLYGEIWNSGDEGGDFIFVKKTTDE